tara:strand:+ start:1099 stop:1680 length:582 start_codon:yes stop_codon:yes gene_type:complete
MSEVPSTFQLSSGQQAPDFTLPDPGGKSVTLTELIAGKSGLVMAFVCNHCPFVVHLSKELGAFAKQCADQNVGFVAISSNDVANYPADSPEKMVQFAADNDWDFPYLYDESQEIAKAYAAACTPDFYLFDGGLKLSYAGQFDDSRPGRGSATGADLHQAVQDMLAGTPTPQPWYPSTGCNIKWKPGSAPDYFR